MAEEKAILVGILKGEDSARALSDSLQELAQLAYSAGARVVQTVIQGRAQWTPAFLIGKGKASEIAEMVTSLKLDIVIFDDDLSGTQQRNLEKLIPCKILDRTGLILDIFAQRARSREGALQVELAQLNYLLPRLMGRGVVMSRLGGGIGTRGPGETELEYDRRRIRDKIARIRRELLIVRKSRAIHREKRQAVPMPSVTIVGYTNAGKSTLLNTLTQAGVLAEDKLFATLDPTTRRLLLPNHQPILLSDTVGFIRKLPPQLIEAFKATLEEIKEADLILHLIDVHHPSFAEQTAEVMRILGEIGVGDIPVLHVYNKIDLDRSNERVRFLKHRRLFPSVMISAMTGGHISELLLSIQGLLEHFFQRIRISIPIKEFRILSQIYDHGRVFSQTYEEGKVVIDAEVLKKFALQLRKLYPLSFITGKVDTPKQTGYRENPKTGKKR